MTVRRYTFILINLIVPLMIGLFIYLTSRSRTILYDTFSVVGIRMQEINHPEIVRNYGCDFLWSYSLYWGVYFWGVFGEWSSLVLKASLIVIPFSMIMEFSQLVQSFPGTFDVLDIVIEILAVALAVIVSFMYGRRQQAYEEVNC